MGTWSEKSTGHKLGCIAVTGLIGAICVSEFAHVTSSARMKARSMTCEDNLKKLAHALLIYAEEHKNHLPDAAHWREAIRPYLKPGNNLGCPEVKSGDGYVMEPRLSNADLGTLEAPAETILLYETDAPDQKPRPPFTKTQHGAPYVVFADGNITRRYGEWQEKLHDRSDALLTKTP